MNGSDKKRAYDAILQDIIRGTFHEEKVLNERSLIERYQIGRAPVREALVSLCSEGVLQSVPRLGYVVVRFTDENLKDILEYRTMLECGCLEKSFENITSTKLRHLEGILESEFMFLSSEDPRGYWGRTLNFHLTLASFAENEYIYGHLDSALNTSMRAYLQLYWDRWRERGFLEPSRLHAQIVEAIRARDKALALELLRRDIHTLYTGDE